MSETRLKGYYRRIFETAVGKESTLFMFTVTDIIGRTCDLNNDTIYRFHLQDAFQRVQMDMRSENGFAVFIMDELNERLHQTLSNVVSLKNKGNVYYKNKQYVEAIEQYKQGIELAFTEPEFITVNEIQEGEIGYKKQELIKELMNMHRNKALCYKLNNQMDMAINELTKATEAPYGQFDMKANGRLFAYLVDGGYTLKASEVYMRIKQILTMNPYEIQENIYTDAITKYNKLVDNVDCGELKVIPINSKSNDEVENDNKNNNNKTNSILNWFVGGFTVSSAIGLGYLIFKYGSKFIKTK
jgi:tetratricopeptide (TPR) repeat protein